MISKISSLITNFFESPSKVFLTCFVFAFVFLVADGSLIQLWGLHRNHLRLKESIVKYETHVNELEEQLKLANRPEFVEKKARDRFDLVNKDEIVFVFSEN